MPQWMSDGDFRLDFDDNGRVGKFVRGSHSTPYAQSDQTAEVTDASENAKHLIGRVDPRSKFLERDTKTVFTSDGKAGFVSGVLLRDVA